jgi:hypothetical protein
MSAWFCPNSLSSVLETDGLPKDGQVYLQIEDRFFELELKLRMLEPCELAAAQGFRKGYQFTGTKTDIVRQIGKCFKNSKLLNRKDRVINADNDRASQ